jgi:hypothetical protein
MTLYSPNIQAGLRNPDGSSTLVSGASSDMLGRKRFLRQQ